MITASLALTFDGQYIGHPYWIEMFKLIEITKKSGMNRARSSANQRKALEEHLRAEGMTLADYERIMTAAQKPFHTAPDGEIIIPADRILSFLVAANDEARAAQRACQPEQVRSRFFATDFRTGKHEADGVWSRFATVASGTGAKLSNQRGLRENAYIEGFTATGRLTFDEAFVNPEALRNLIVWGGMFVGIGASRKMGKGRFTLTAYDLSGNTAALAAE